MSPLRLGTLIARAVRKRWKRMLRRAGVPNRPQRDKSVKKRRGSRRSPTGPNSPGEIGPAKILSAAPPVFLSGLPFCEYLGIARAFARHYGNVKAGFLIFPTWSIERSGFPEAIQRSFIEHLKQYPNHRFRFICNTRREAALLEQLGVPAEFLNKNFMVSDSIFRPVPDIKVEFDAIYNARFIPEKRHELAALVPRVGYLTYIDIEDRRRNQFRELCPTVLARSPGHVLLNELVDGLPAVMSHDRVNAALSRAAVGLLLSEVEGSSYATVEYLLAGLPVVSTPSSGGRDVYFDPEFCIVCEPDPAAVRDAVAELRARNIPREVVRARTIARIQRDREHFLSLVDDMIEDLGGRRRYAGRVWPFGDRSGVAWRAFEAHLAELAERQRAELAEEIGLSPDLLTNAQLEVGELRPIMTAIAERPGCALLVFGCGHDSPLWERINRGGTTVFLEDNPRWAARARTGLATATVHDVRYGTKLADWPRLLDRPSELDMDLPPEVASRRWDVILVDGPAGHDNAQPGRMKSIYAASRLVAPGGRVFVHDSERPAEHAFASRYLGDDRLLINVRGRGVLRGYAF